jgi:DNA-binding MurR/RpiR family transcriptional regulator
MLLVHEDLAPDDGPASAVQKAMTAGMRSLEDTVRILELPVLEAAVQALCSARQIELFASGNSVPLAMDLNFRLTKIGLHEFRDRPMKFLSGGMKQKLVPRPD